MGMCGSALRNRHWNASHVRQAVSRSHERQHAVCGPLYEPDRDWETPETDLYNLRIFLLDTLDLIELDPRITAAADELHRLASECVYEQEREVLTHEEPHVRPEQGRLARVALLTLRDVLLQACPRDRNGIW